MMNAFQVTEYGQPPSFQTSVPRPKPASGDVLVRVKAAALNPVDNVISQGYFKWASLPVTLGSDVSGIVEEIGPNVSRFRIGDEVFGFSGVNDGHGAFAEYCLMPEAFAMKRPPSISFEEAATLGHAGFTAGLGLFKATGLPISSKLDESSYCLVWNASGSVGSYAVQLAKAAGFSVIGACSSRNIGLVRELGADLAVDRTSPDVVDQIKRFTGGKLTYVFDATSKPDSFEKCIACLPSNIEVNYIAVLPSKTRFPSNVHLHQILLATVEPETYPFFMELGDHFSRLLQTKRLKPNIVQKLEGGLKGIPKGLEAMAKGAVSGKKQVIVIEETP